jgi:hypothetical protein
MVLIDIKHAFQALGLDEHREHFSPMLWYLPDKKEITSEELEAQQKRIDDALAAWYPKAYDKKVPLEKRQALKKAYNEARRTLSRMREQCKPPSELLQVWFPGVHINIGGGSSAWLENKGDLEGEFVALSLNSRLANKYRNGQHHLRVDARSSKPLRFHQREHSLARDPRAPGTH